MALLPENPIAVGTITLRDTLSDFPHLWRQLIQAVGVPVIETPQTEPQGRADTDLQRLQHHLLGSLLDKTPPKHPGKNAPAG